MSRGPRAILGHCEFVPGRRPGEGRRPAGMQTTFRGAAPGLRGSPSYPSPVPRLKCCPPSLSADKTRLKNQTQQKPKAKPTKKPTEQKNTQPHRSAADCLQDPTGRLARWNTPGRAGPAPPRGTGAGDGCSSCGIIWKINTAPSPLLAQREGLLRPWEMLVREQNTVAVTSKAQSLPFSTAGPPWVPAPTETAGRKGLFCCRFFGLAMGAFGGFFGWGGGFFVWLVGGFFTWDALRCFRPLAGQTDHPPPRCRPRRESEGLAPARRPQPPSPGEAAACGDLSPARAAKTRHQPQTATGETNKQAKTKQRRARFQSCLPKTNEQSPAGARWHRRGRQGGLAGGGGTPGTAQPSPAPPAGPETTLRSEFSSRRCADRPGSAGSRVEKGDDPSPEEDETSGPPLPGSATERKAPCSPGDAHARSAVGGQGDFPGTGPFPAVQSRRAPAVPGHGRTARPELKLRGRGSGDAPRTTSASRRERVQRPHKRG